MNFAVIKPKESRTVKLNFTIEENIAKEIKKISKGKRSSWINMIIKDYLTKRKKEKIIEGFKQEVEDFDSWENLGFEAWK